MSKNVVIIGAGVIGLCSALNAARRGHRVVVVEKNDKLHEGCSHGNAGMIVPSHFVPLAAPGMVALGLKWLWNPESPFYIKPRLDADLMDWGFKFWRAATPAHVSAAAPLLRDLSFTSRTFFEELADESENEFELVKHGLLMLCKTQHALDEEAKSAVLANHLGVEAQVLDARQTSAMEPDVALDVVGSVYFPNDCQLTPKLFLRTLRRRCRDAGVEFHFNTEITKVEVQNSRIQSVTAGHTEFKVGELVLCAGSWSSFLASALGLKIPMQAGKGYSLTLPSPRRKLRLCSILTEARVAVTPMGDELRVGGTMELAGMNEEVSPRRVNGIVKAFPRYYADFKEEDFAEIKPWAGLRPCSPDGLPYLGRTQKFKNLCIATGHAMMGVSLGPVTGDIVGKLLDDEDPGFDLRLLSPDRF
jgi:D-amino-acid dehydrogenase